MQGSGGGWETADFLDLLDRFQRIDEATRLGAAEFALRRGTTLAIALEDVCVEAMRVTEVAQRVAADDDLWPVLGGVVGLWSRLAELLDDVGAVGAVVTPDPDDARAMARSLVDIGNSATAVQDSLRELRDHPTDRATAAAAKVAIRELREAGDRLVVAALGVPGTRRLDAAVAVLMAAAAVAGRADRERARLQPGRK